jgi:predicted TPR repeat methyltransferase
MSGTFFPSGDLAADRRAGFAEQMAHLGDFAAAIDIMQQALELVPGWAAGWFRLGEFFRSVGEDNAAIDAWNRAVAADPADPLGAGINRDLLRRVPITESLPPAFVETLFDQYAPRFERSLVERLDYRGPEMVMYALQSAGFRHAACAIDLGCGTGLMGAQLRPNCDWLAGYDISQGMLSEAAAKGDYDLLEKRDIATQDRAPDSADLIVAADVFIYLGALERVVGWCVDALRPGGYLAFTVELGDEPVALQDSRRFTHSRAYIEGLLADAGLVTPRLQEVVLRYDRGAPVQSLIVTARRAGLAVDAPSEEAHVRVH